MKLLIDLGNTRLKWACESKGAIEQTGFLLSQGLSRSLLDESFSAIARPKSVWISSVGSHRSHKVLLEWLLHRYQLNANVVNVRQPIKGFSNAYADLGALGVDRWVAAIGARACVATHCAADGVAGPEDLIIIDVGTAITIDHLSADNIFQGGVIHPGYQLMHDSLIGGTVGIKSAFYGADQIIGKTTSDCVNSGIAFGVAGAVQRVVNEMQKAIGSTTQIVLTGGGTQALLDKIDLDVLLEPSLVLHGLAKIAALQAEKTSTT